MPPHVEAPPEHGGESLRGYALNIVAAGVLIAVLYWARIVFITITAAVITALILEPLVSLLVKIRFPRALASFVVCGVALLALYFIGFAAYQQVSRIASEAPAFRENLATFIENVSDRVQGLQDAGAHIFARKQQPLPAQTPSNNSKKNRKATSAPAPAVVGTIGAPNQPGVAVPVVIPEVRIHSDPIADYLFAQLGTLYQFLLMASFVPLLVYFMLSWRDHLVQSFLQFFEGPDRMTAALSLQGIAVMARAFVAGNFIIGVILASLSTALFAVIHLEYPFLAGVLSGFLSLVPYVGIILAGVPPLIAALATGAPSSTLVFGVLIAVGLHLVAMNVLYPTMVGARVHLNPLIVTLSLMFWGFLWDASGLLLAIPITAGLKAVCDNVARLKNYGRILGD
jgi:predicted PurR-regulated permease PerM